ncbi:hypothetical protein [Clostridium sp. Marseille-P2415]|uniref:hypothetical protein n=1 Tax=Clostridium sp. Marseille-P2415 TaxID=1805471 RepID=UPI0009883485|nr:hypothetical protein [Clostridium sp. Marseille-P2415]
MNKFYVKISIIFLTISTIFFPYYFGFDDGRLEKAFGFPYGYIYFKEMKVSMIRSMNIDLSYLLVDFLIIYLCIRVGAKIFNFIKSIIVRY